MSHCPKRCPRCNAEGTLENNHGGDAHTVAHGSHFLSHGAAHGNPLMLAVGGAALVYRLLNPRTYTCTRCGHKVKA